MIENNVPADDTDWEIRIEGLHRAFGAHKVLRGVDLDVHRGEMVAFVGGSGCGKTVLLNHILSQLQPDAGRVQVADHDLLDAPLVDLADLRGSELDRLHTHWGVVFQRNALFSGSVEGNIELWLDEIKHMKDADMRAVAKRVLAAVALDNDDDFLDTDVNDLSGGMAKRLAVARALAQEPNVIFYDEPTTGLDPTSATQIQDLILEMHLDGVAQRRTTIIITHDKDLLNRLEPRTMMLFEGQVHFDGPFCDFAKSKSAIIRPYFELMPVFQQGHGPQGRGTDGTGDGRDRHG
jgi:phospholipid/cholesterol/gamma-HCH transport system ATP-binding protein